MATVHPAPGDVTQHRNWRPLLIFVLLVVAVAIIYSVASVVSREGPSDTAVVPADQPVTGGLTTEGGIVDPQPRADTPRAPADTPLSGQSVTDGAGQGTVTDPTMGPTENGITNGARPTDG